MNQVSSLCQAASREAHALNQLWSSEHRQHRTEKLVDLVSGLTLLLATFVTLSSSSLWAPVSSPTICTPNDCSED